MMPPKRFRQEENVDNWLMSYADMITLLLAFFILFVAVADPKGEKMQAITESLSGKFGTIDLSTPFQGTYKTLQALVEERQLLKDMDIQRTKDGIQIELSHGAFFKPRSTELAPDKIDTLKEIAASIKSIDFLDYRVAIEAYSSDVEPGLPAYPSNWEYTSAQASRLARFFIKEGIDPTRLKVVGYADSMPKVPNADVEGKPIPDNRKQNERIEIIVDRKP